MGRQFLVNGTVTPLLESLSEQQPEAVIVHDHIIISLKTLNLGGANNHFGLMYLIGYPAGVRLQLLLYFQSF